MARLKTYHIMLRDNKVATFHKVIRDKKTVKPY